MPVGSGSTTTTQGRFLSRVPIPLFASAVETTFSGRHGECRTRHGRGRRLRAALRHERQSIAMALAELTHHTAPRGQRMARARGWVRVEAHGGVPEEPTSKTTTAYRSSGARALTASLAQGRRSGFSGTPWSRSSTLSPCRRSMLLSR